MADRFAYDVFLSHNSKDKPRVRRLAERLKQAGLRVWFDEWVIKPGDDIYLAIERGLNAARTLVFCMSSNAFGSDWVTLERNTVLFRDPSNAGRRFIPLLLADCELPDTLSRYKYLDFRKKANEDAAFEELLAACEPEAEVGPPAPSKKVPKGIIQPKVEPMRSTDLPSPSPSAFPPPAPLPVFLGRKQERGVLTKWFKAREVPVCLIWGIGGNGKTSLASHWTRHDSQAESVVWWTFEYASPAAFDEFVCKVEAGLRGTREPSAVRSDATAWQVLAEELQRHSTLLVWDQAQYLFGQGQDNLPEGPVADRITEFLSAVTRAGSARVIIISTTDLTGVVRQHLRIKPETVSLGGLSAQDARALLHHAGREWTDEECDAVREYVSGSPLTLAQICEYSRPEAVLQDAVLWIATPAAARNLPADIRNHTVQATIADLPPPKRNLLLALSVVEDRNIRGATVKRIADALKIQSDSLESGISALVRRGLVARGDADTLMLHSVAREEGRRMFNVQDAGLAAALDALCDLTRTRLPDKLLQDCDQPLAPGEAFDNEPIRVLIQPRSIQLLPEAHIQQLVHLFIYTLRKGAQRDAFRILANVLACELYYGQGDYDLLIRLTSGLDAPTLGLSKREEIWLASIRGSAFARIGKLDRALEFLNQAVDLADKLEDVRLGGVVRGTRAFDLALMGRFEDSYRDQTWRINNMMDDPFDISTAHLGCAYIDILRGRFQEADSHLIAAAQLADEAREDHALLYVDIVRVVLQLAKAQAGLAPVDAETSNVAETVLENARLQGITSDICRCEWLMGLVAMSRARQDVGRESQHMKASWTWFTRARNRSDRMNLVHMQTELDIACAWHCVARGDYDDALTYATCAQYNAARCDARPSRAEALLLRGICNSHVNPETARELFERASVEARCQDPENRIHSVCHRLQSVSDPGARSAT